MCAATAPEDGQTLAERIVAEAEAAYRRLPRKGKPAAGREWSVVAAFVAGRADGRGLRTVALATGNKCVGGRAARAATAGDVVLDGHAEVLARRALRRLLLDDARRLRSGTGDAVLLERCDDGDASDGDAPHGALRLRADAAALHLVVSALPCGDAAVYCTESSSSSAKDEDDKEQEGTTEGPESKRARTDACAGMHVTGARRTAGEAGGQRVSVWEEAAGDAGGAVALGACRAKPGRGDPSESMSCSDKLAMWACTGVQGALAGTLLARPLVLATVVVCGGHGTAAPTLAAMQAAAVRALCGRVAAVAAAGGTPTAVTVLPHSFAGVAERADTLCAAGAGVVWHAGGLHEVVLTHMGKKLGTTKAKFGAPANCSEVAKRRLFELYLQATGGSAQADEAGHRTTYAEAKRANTAYCATKQQVKEQALTNWLPKIPSLDDFHL